MDRLTSAKAAAEAAAGVLVNQTHLDWQEQGRQTAPWLQPQLGALWPSAAETHPATGTCVTNRGIKRNPTEEPSAFFLGNRSVSIWSVWFGRSPNGPGVDT